MLAVPRVGLIKYLMSNDLKCNHVQVYLQSESILNSAVDVMKCFERILGFEVMVGYYSNLYGEHELRELLHTCGIPNLNGMVAHAACEISQA